jgi:hypothetical protein
LSKIFPLAALQFCLWAGSFDESEKFGLLKDKALILAFDGDFVVWTTKITNREDLCKFYRWFSAIVLYILAGFSDIVYFNKNPRHKKTIYTVDLVYS